MTESTFGQPLRAQPRILFWDATAGLCHGNGRWAGREWLTQISRCRDGVLPLRCCLGSKAPQRRSGDEMALKVERVMDGSVHIKKALGGASRLELLHFTLSSSHDLVGVRGAVVRP